MAKLINLKVFISIIALEDKLLLKKTKKISDRLLFMQ
jgi:hypothetical protein